MESLTLSSSILLGLALFLACVFEFANGFHDTANAVATVIYTRTLKPRLAVLWSGFCNFLGVFAGGIGVAMSIVYLLPTELLLSQGAGGAMPMVLAILLAAITWNIGTWYFGIPSSSSHTLIGAILGVGLANSLLPGHHFGAGVNWLKARDIMLSLLISPLLGFWLGAILLLMLRQLDRHKVLFHVPRGKDRPPRQVRAVLLATCTGVSFAHGSNDGQKGVGLVLLILIGAMPATFSVKPTITALEHTAARESLRAIDQRVTGPGSELARAKVADIQRVLVKNSEQWTGSERRELRSSIVRLGDELRTLEPYRKPGGELLLKKDQKALRVLVEFAPHWVVVMVALSLGLGTLIGWKRVVITVGERIGKAHLNYAQGATAESVAMAMIGVAAFAGVPVSTTHVLSSAITGTMAAQKSGVQMDTIRKIALAWLLTLPVSILLAGVFFLLLRVAFSA